MRRNFLPPTFELSGRETLSPSIFNPDSSSSGMEELPISSAPAEIRKEDPDTSPGHFPRTRGGGTIKRKPFWRGARLAPNEKGAAERETEQQAAGPR